MAYSAQGESAFSIIPVFPLSILFKEEERGGVIFFKKEWANPSLFFVYFRSFSKKQYIFLQHINVKNVHPVYSAGIQTHNFSKMSCHP